MKLKLIALAAVMAAAGAANAQVAGATSGNGSLLVDFVTTGATASAGTSGVFNLGIDMNTFIANASVAGYSQTWNLAGSNYGTAWGDLLTAGATSGLSYNVIALDNTDFTTVGGSRYLTTAGTQLGAFPSVTAANLSGFQGMDAYVLANATRGTMATGAGAATANPTSPPNSYFAAINGSGTGATWLAKGPNTIASTSAAQNFWFLTTNSLTLPAVRTAFGYDVNGNGSIGTGEYGQWSVNQAAGTITFTNPVPEPETFAMLLAGLGLMGAIVRRRKTAA